MKQLVFVGAGARNLANVAAGGATIQAQARENLGLVYVEVADSTARLAMPVASATGRLVYQASDGTMWAFTPGADDTSDSGNWVTVGGGSGGAFFGRADVYNLTATETVTVTFTSGELLDRRTFVVASSGSNATAIVVLARSGAVTGAIAVLNLRFPMYRTNAIEVRDDSAGGTLLYRAIGAQGSHAVQVICQRTSSGWELISYDPAAADVPHNIQMARWAAEAYLLSTNSHQTFAGGAASATLVQLNTATQWSSAVGQGGNLTVHTLGRQISNVLFSLNWDVLFRLESKLHDVLGQCPQFAFRWGIVSNSSGWVTASASNNVGLPASTMVGIGFEVRDNASWWGWTHNGTTLVYTDLGFSQADRGGGQGGMMTEAAMSYDKSGIVRWYVAGVERASYQMTGSWASAAGTYPRLLVAGTVGDTPAAANSAPMLALHRTVIRVP